MFYVEHGGVLDSMPWSDQDGGFDVRHFPGVRNLIWSRCDRPAATF